jgi:subtilase family serine protease
VRIHQQIVTVSLASALGLAGIAALAAPSVAQQPARVTGTVRIAASAAAPVPAGARRLGDLAPASRLKIDVTLNVPRPAALSAFITDVNDRQSPLFGHFLRAGQFGPMFGPTLAHVAAVRAALREAGLVPGPTAADRLSIPVTASATAIEHAFGISLVNYRLPGGRVAYANAQAPRVPAAVAPYVSGVIGLSTFYLDQDNIAGEARLARPAPASAGRGSPPRPGTSGPKACKAISGNKDHTISRFASYYGMSSMYGLGDFGGGVRVALFEQEPNLTNDIAAFEKCYGVKTKVTYTKVDGGAGKGAGEGEAALDIENVIGLSPAVTVDVYQGPNKTAADPYDIYQKIINADKDQVISTSWGLCESFTEKSVISSEDKLFEQAASQGQTVFAAAGDSGSTACYQSDHGNHKLGVQNPASQPDVVAVGGTTIEKSGAQEIWNDSKTEEGAGGGGLSSYWCMPSYQYGTAIPGLISKYSKKNGNCPGADDGHYIRQTPDVSASAGSGSYYLVYYKGHWDEFWGTSAAAPLWASVAALTDASPFCKVWKSGHPGALPQGLYYVADEFGHYVYGAENEGLADVRSGNNDYTTSGYKGKLYPSTKGYDMASGLGTPLVSGLSGTKASTFYPGLAALMCYVYASNFTAATVSSVSPAYGPLGGGQKVTVTGAGFLPIAGADYALVGSTYVTATCSSTTTCTLTTPKGTTGTVNIEMNVEDLGPSSPTAGDVYGYEPAPAITELSPSSGPTGGGNAVTIDGSNFYGNVTVHFGAAAATDVEVVSPTEITVVAPAGTGTVQVTVTAAGGTSTGSSYSY